MWIRSTTTIHPLKKKRKDIHVKPELAGTI
jgi:hypothetical protein